jgi:hypothetical protein
MDKETLYQYLKTQCTPSLLKELSLKIIDAYKSKDYRSLIRIATRIFPDRDHSNEKGNKIFFMLIKHFHPDRYTLIMNDIEAAFDQNNVGRLEFYKKLFSEGSAVKEHRKKDIQWETHEEYGFDESDFDHDYEYDYTDIFENQSNAEVYETDEEFDFYSAVKSAIYGNLDFDVEPEDLEFLAGELDLSDYSLDDLDGLEYCIRITSLNLSNNRISNLYNIEGLRDLRELYLADNAINDIDYLHGLSALEILDLSGNDIDDISVLLELEELRFVDLRDNPVKDRETITALKERAVVVIE